MEYTIKFDFNCISKRNMISAKTGEVDITTEDSPEGLKKSNELIKLIATEMARKTRQSVISVKITECCLIKPLPAPPKDLTPKTDTTDGEY